MENNIIGKKLERKNIMALKKPKYVHVILNGDLDFLNDNISEICNRDELEYVDSKILHTDFHNQKYIIMYILKSRSKVIIKNQNE